MHNLDHDIVHRLKFVLNRLSNGRKVQWKFYKEYAVTEKGEIVYQDEVPISWQEYVGDE